MKKSLSFIALLSLCISVSAQAKDKLTLMLDWFVNPDHAAIIVAQQKGYFAEQNLDVEIIEPADPSMPPKLVAAGKADLAVDYQPQLHMQVSEGLPLVRVATLVSTPLNTLVVLKSSDIKKMADFKGKRIGYSVSGFEDGLLKAMLKTGNLSIKDVELVNVNWSLSPSLLSGQVDGVIGAYRNFELNQLDLEKHPGFAFYPEENNVPNYDELIIVAAKKNLDKQKLNAFLNALEKATVFSLNHPQEAWQAFVSYKPKELDNELNRRAWKDTLPRLALRPRALDSQRYRKMAEFLAQQKLIKQSLPVADYAIELQ